MDLCSGEQFINRKCCCQLPCSCKRHKFQPATQTSTHLNPNVTELTNSRTRVTSPWFPAICGFLKGGFSDICCWEIPTFTTMLGYLKNLGLIRWRRWSVCTGRMVIGQTKVKIIGLHWTFWLGTDSPPGHSPYGLRRFRQKFSIARPWRFLRCRLTPRKENAQEAGGLLAFW